MGAYLDTTGKIFLTAIASYVGAKIASKHISKYIEEKHAETSRVIEENIPPHLQAALQNHASHGDQSGFHSLLNNNNCPRDTNLRSYLWKYFGGN